MTGGLGVDLQRSRLEVRCQKTILSPTQKSLWKQRQLTEKKHESMVQGLEQGVKGLLPPQDKKQKQKHTSKKI